MTTAPTPPSAVERTDVAASEFAPGTYDSVTAIRGRTQWEIFWRRFRAHKLGLVGLGVLILIGLAALLAPVVSPYPVNGVDITKIFESPNLHHPFGTAELGQDEATRVLTAGRVSLAVGLGTAAVAAVVGTILGLVAGFFGGWSDSGIARVTDMFLAAPALIVLISLRLTFGNVGLAEIIFILALLSWMPLTRIVRASVLSLKERDFVQAARAMGASRWRIMWRHLLPNAIAEIIVFTTLIVGIAILTEAALSYLGLGINSAITPSWGNLLSLEQAHVLGGVYWWLTVFPGAFILLTVLCINFVGDALRDALDPYGISFGGQGGGDH